MWSQFVSRCVERFDWGGSMVLVALLGTGLFFILLISSLGSGFIDWLAHL